VVIDYLRDRLSIYMASIIDIKLPRAIAAALRIPANDARRQQLRVLRKLLRKARFTEFGQHYRFDDIFRTWYPYTTIIPSTSSGGKRRLMVYRMLRGPARSNIMH
jgi:hypothetical protein